MSKNPTRRIAPAVLQADLESFAALQAITTYAPANAAYTLAAITALKQSMETKQTAETQAAANLAAARDGATDGEWGFHNAILGMKIQVNAQYGENSGRSTGPALPPLTLSPPTPALWKSTFHCGKRVRT